MSRAPTAEPRRRGASSCPVCGKPASADRTPFCSQGCRDRDLSNWLGDGYRMPGPPATASDDPFGDSAD